MIDSEIFTSCKIGNLTLKNRTIRSAAFENMCRNNRPSQELFDYHVAVARGGVAMTTVAYASVNRSGISFKGQLWLRDEIIPELRTLTDAIHREGAKASIQLGHCGNMTHFSTSGGMPVGASGGINIYSPTIVRALKEKEIFSIVQDFGKAVSIARKAGFDCVEIHAGHGYLIGQFLSPYTNRRKDRWGGSLSNRMRFMEQVITEVMRVAGNEMTVVVKTNMFDGFKGGMDEEDCLKVARRLEALGVHALVFSAGFVSKAPMQVMRGAMPIRSLVHYMNPFRYGWLRLSVRLFGKMMIPPVTYEEAYFLETAKKFRAALKLPLIYVGGMTSREKMEEVLSCGFVAFQMARALINDTGFVEKLRQGTLSKSPCGHSNYCIARMYSKNMQCYHCTEKIPKTIKKEIEELENRYSDRKKS